MITLNKYYVMIPSTYTHEGKPTWLELHGIETLAAAQAYIDLNLKGLQTAEIAESVNGAPETVVAKKNKAGQWVAVN